MIEPEMAFYDLEDNMNLAEAFIRYLIRYVMDHNREDLEFLAQRLAEEEKQRPQAERSELGLIEKLEFVLNNEFERITIPRPSTSCCNRPPIKRRNSSTK
jgi:asparaginyl-tRNA synthetase